MIVYNEKKDDGKPEAGAAVSANPAWEGLFMILEGCTLRGTMHHQYGVANQDRFKTGEIKDCAVGIVCDGVSLNSKHQFSNSEMAAQVVSDCIYEYLEEHLEKDLKTEKLAELIFNAFTFADDTLRTILKEAGIEWYDCQTTALTFIWRKGVLVCGMAGDGGVLFETKDGNLGLLETRIKTSSSVDPISDRHAWKFGMAGSRGNPVYRAILATDGIFDALVSSSADGVGVNMPAVLSIFELSSVKRNHRAADLKRIAENIPSHDDKTVVFFYDSRYAPNLQGVHSFKNV